MKTEIPIIVETPERWYNKEMNNLIEVISTGGTIDSFFNKKQDKIQPLKKSVLPSYFEDIVRIKPDCMYYELCMKDSRDFDLEKDTDALITHIRSSVASYFLVTIGTFAMPDVALQISKAYDWKSLNKTIIFSGAMCPMQGFLESDAGFNLGYALTQFRIQNESPVLLSMNAEATKAGQVAKDLRTGNFRPVNIREITEKNLQSPIHIICTGGSMDTRYDGLDGVSLHDQSQVVHYLRSLELHKKMSFTELKELKHSYELSKKDFSYILQSIKESPHKNIIITMGTYSIEKFSKYLQQHSSSIKEKKIVLTGSRYTLSHDDITDATFNLGYSIGAINELKNGVHIAMSGDIIPPEKFLETLYTPDELATIKARLKS